MKRNRMVSILKLGLVAALLLPLTLNAQGSSAGDSAKADATAPMVERTIVMIFNDNLLDMRVVAESGGRRHQLGTVTGFSTATYVLPGWMLAANAPLQLVAHAVGSARGYASPLVIVEPGDLVEWQLRNNLSLSSISVWRS